MYVYTYIMFKTIKMKGVLGEPLTLTYHGQLAGGAAHGGAAGRGEERQNRTPAGWSAQESTVFLAH